MREHSRAEDRKMKDFKIEWLAGRAKFGKSLTPLPSVGERVKAGLLMSSTQAFKSERMQVERLDE